MKSVKSARFFKQIFTTLAQYQAMRHLTVHLQFSSTIAYLQFPYTQQQPREHSTSSNLCQGLQYILQC